MHFRLCLRWKRVVSFRLWLFYINKSNHQLRLDDRFDDRDDMSATAKETSLCRIWSSHSGCYEEFWDITPCSPLKVKRICCLYLQGRMNQAELIKWFIVVSFLAYYSTLKVEATCSSETSFDFQRTTWHYIPEDTTLQKHPFPCRESNPDRPSRSQ
jgi:hypothetical protein